MGNSDGFFGKVVVPQLESDGNIPTAPYNVLLTSGGRVEVGQAAIQGYATLKWSSYNTGVVRYEIKVKEDGSVDEQEVIIMADKNAGTSTLFGDPEFGVLTYGGGASGVVLTTLNPNSIYICAVRVVNKAGVSDWVWSNAVSTGAPLTATVSDLTYIELYRAVSLSWVNGIATDTVNIKYRKNGGSEVVIENYKGTSFYLETGDETVLDYVKLEPNNFEGESFTAVDFHTSDIEPKSLVEYDGTFSIRDWKSVV